MEKQELLRSIPSVENPVPLHEWIGQNVPKDTMLWKKDLENQLDFISRIGALVTKEGRKIQVISEHSSKSIRLPVYYIKHHGLEIILRNNFYNWKLSVICDSPIEADFTKLFHVDPPIEPDYTGDELADVYFEGFPKDLIFGYYSKSDKKRWSANIHANEDLWVVIWKIVDVLDYIPKMKWHTKESHRKQLAERRVKREAKLKAEKG